MTVTARTQEAKINYVVNKLDVNDKFNINFKYINNDENIGVFIRDKKGDKKALKLDIDYSITPSDGVNNVWGVMTILKAVEDVKSICAYRNIPVSQERVFNSQTVFSTTTEDALDKLTMIAQDQFANDRALRVSVDDTVNPGDLELPLAKDATGFVYRDETGKFKIGGTAEASHALRQSFGEVDDPSFAMNKYERANNIVGFDAEGSVKYVKPYSAGTNVSISQENVISAIDTKYTAGTNVSISEDNVISAVDTKYKAGTNIDISDDNTISATDTKYTAGDNVQISPDNEISATDTTYTAGDNVQISPDNVVSATDTTYTAGNRISISSENVISTPNYEAGDNIQIDGNIISATDTTYTAGENINISPENVISGKSYDIKQEQIPYFQILEDLDGKYNQVFKFYYMTGGNGNYAVQWSTSSSARTVKYANPYGQYLPGQIPWTEKQTDLPSWVLVKAFDLYSSNMVIIDDASNTVYKSTNFVHYTAAKMPQGVTLPHFVKCAMTEQRVVLMGDDRSLWVSDFSVMDFRNPLSYTPSSAYDIQKAKLYFVGYYIMVDTQDGKGTIDIISAVDGGQKNLMSDFAYSSVVSTVDMAREHLYVLAEKPDGSNTFLTVRTPSTLSAINIRMPVKVVHNWSNLVALPDGGFVASGEGDIHKLYSYPTNPEPDALWNVFYSDKIEWKNMVLSWRGMWMSRQTNGYLYSLWRPLQETVSRNSIPLVAGGNIKIWYDGASFRRISAPKYIPGKDVDIYETDNGVEVQSYNTLSTLVAREQNNLNSGLYGPSLWAGNGNDIPLIRLLLSTGAVYFVKSDFTTQEKGSLNSDIIYAVSNDNQNEEYGAAISIAAVYSKYIKVFSCNKTSFALRATIDSNNGLNLAEGEDLRWAAIMQTYYSKKRVVVCCSSLGKLYAWDAASNTCHQMQGDYSLPGHLIQSDVQVLNFSFDDVYPIMLYKKTTGEVQKLGLASDLGKYYIYDKHKVDENSLVACTGGFAVFASTKHARIFRIKSNSYITSPPFEMFLCKAKGGEHIGNIQAFNKLDNRGNFVLLSDFNRDQYQIFTSRDFGKHWEFAGLDKKTYSSYEFLTPGFSRNRIILMSGNTGASGQGFAIQPAVQWLAETN